MRTIALIGILLSLSCSSKKVVSSDDQNNTVSESMVTDELFMTFERSMCFGECPAYKITVTSNGKAYYEGRKFTPLIGNYVATITVDQMNEILEEAGRVGYFEMEDEYDNQAVTDVPSCMIMIAKANKRKSVHDRFEAPDTLKNFEKYLDSILLNLDWKKAED